MSRRPTMSDHIPLSKRIQIDDATDLVTIDGAIFCGDVLSLFTKPSAEGRWFRVLSKDERGVLTFQIRDDPEVAP